MTSELVRILGSRAVSLTFVVAVVQRPRQNGGVEIVGLNRTAWDKAVEGGDNPFTRWSRASK